VLFPQLLLTLALLSICCFAPGFLLVRRLRWSGLEKLCGAVALSLILLWLAVWGVYVLAPAAQPGAYYAIVALCVASGAVAWREAWALFLTPRVRRAIAGYGFVLAWTLAILCIIRVYSGAIWSGDWLEHFQRTLYFLHHFPKETPVYGDYLLPARPPMMNVLAALFLGVTADRYEIFQVVFAFLNLLLFLPCCLAIPLVARVRKVSVLPLTAIFAMNPAVMQNATYTWTKSLTAFFVIFAVCLYLAGWRKRDSVRMTGAFACLAAGLLVHYSAGPYVAFFALHYLLVVWRTRPEKWRELAAVAAVSALLLATWFGWSVAALGTKATFASNTSVTASQQYEGSNLGKIAGNFLDSFVPAILQDPEKIHLYDQPYTPAMVRDHLFTIYQANVIFSMGLIGGPLVVWFVISAFRSGGRRGAERTFWLWLIGFTLIVGIAVVGERDLFGVGHLTLIPMEALGLTLLSAQFFRRRWIAFAIVAGCALDFAFVFFHARIQNLENTPQHRYHAEMSVSDGHFLIGVAGPDSMGGGSWRNWFAKRQPILCKGWLEQEERFRPGDPALEAGRADLREAMRDKLAEDQKYFRGWYAAHGGQVGFLGDAFGEGMLPSAVLLLMAGGLLWKLVRSFPRIASVDRAAVKPKSSQSRRKR
jgi:4-amino-4-deoxy-L-arabinose transferase-like glycosyltransferase